MILALDLSQILDIYVINGPRRLQNNFKPQFMGTSLFQEELNLYAEMGKAIWNMSEFSLAGLMFTFLFGNKFFIRKKQTEEYKRQLIQLKSEFVVSAILNDCSK